jgi:phenylacetate-coenzyme A ligase PaaK-like adenylate-forming protein
LPSEKVRGATVGQAIIALPHAVVVRDTVVAAIRDGALLERRLAAWRRGHLEGQKEVLSLSDEAMDSSMIDKNTLRADPKRFLASGQGLAVKYTSGTTGRPVPIFYDLPTLLEQMIVVPRRISALYASLEELERPLEPMVTLSITENPAAREEIWIDPWGGFVAQIVVDEADPVTFRRFVHLVHVLRPNLITIKPILLSVLVEQQGDAQAFAGYADLVAVSGSDFGPVARTQAELSLGVPVVEGYGLTEFGFVASGCKAHALHIDPDIFPEILDTSSNTLLPFNEFESLEGELILSSSRNSAFPLTRYRTGDLATLRRGSCTCGRKTPSIISLSGRIVENFKLAGGRACSPTRFNHLFDAHPIAEFQLSQSAPGIFTLVVEPLRDVELNQTRIEADLRVVIGRDSRLNLKVGRIERGGKFQRFRIGKI